MERVPEISVIVPVYNVQDYLEKCVDSILNQTFGNLEILLVDDGSTDESGRICDRLARDHSRIRVFHQENRGLSDARNTGIRNASGDLIGLVDSDDYLAPEMYDRLYGALTEADAQAAVCGYLKVDAEGCPIPGTDQKNYRINKAVMDGQEFVSKRFLESSGVVIMACNKLYRKALFDTVLFPEGRIHEDHFVFTRLLLPCKRIACIPYIGYYYYQREGSITNRKASLRQYDRVEAIRGNIADCEKAGLTVLLPSMESNMFYYLWDTYSGLAPGEQRSERAKEAVRLHGEVLGLLKKHGMLSGKIYLRSLLFHTAPGLYLLIRKGRNR